MLALIGFMAAFGAVWIQSNYPRVTNKTSDLGIRIGDRVVLAGKSHRPTLLVFLSQQCPACRNNIPAFRSLLMELRLKSIGYAVIVPGAGDREFFLEQLECGERSVKVAAIRSFGVRATPTMILLAPNGIVARVWVGMRPGEDGRLLESINRTAQYLTKIVFYSDADADSVSAMNGASTRIDMRERDSFKLRPRKGFTNIPLEEFGARVGGVIRPGDVVVMNCSGVNSEFGLRAALDVLSHGASSIVVLNLDSRVVASDANV